MWAYEKSFERLDVKVAQILLTHHDLADRRRFLNARHTLSALIGFGVIPIINENDTVAVDEIRVEQRHPGCRWPIWSTRNC
jgi:glutamate 5-kinase